MQEVTINETTDKNTTKYITITKYVTIKDTVTNEYPIESITEIKEVNNDKIKTETKSDVKTESKETVIEDKETKSETSNYIWCFIAGIVSTLIIIIIIKLLIWYIKK